MCRSWTMACVIATTAVVAACSARGRKGPPDTAEAAAPDMEARAEIGELKILVENYEHASEVFEGQLRRCIERGDEDCTEVRVGAAFAEFRVARARDKLGEYGGRKAPTAAQPLPRDARATMYDPMLACAGDGVSYKFVRPGLFRLDVRSDLRGSSRPSLCVVRRGVRDCRSTSDSTRWADVAADDLLQVLAADGKTVLDASTCPGDGVAWLAEWSTIPTALDLWDPQDQTRKIFEVSAMAEPWEHGDFACSPDGSFYLFNRDGRYDVAVDGQLQNGSPTSSVCILSGATRDCRVVADAPFTIEVKKGDQVHGIAPDKKTPLFSGNCPSEAPLSSIEWYASRADADRPDGQRVRPDVVVKIMRAHSLRPPPPDL